MSPEALLATSLRVSTNSATLLIGPTGATKSTQLAHFAEYVKEVHGGTTRVYSTDGGGWPGHVERLIRFGVMEVWRLRTRGLDLAFETMTRATMGYWPARIKKLTGESPYNCPLLPPIALKYLSICPKCGGHSKEATSQSAIGPHPCAICKFMIPAGQLVVQKSVQQHPAFAHVKAVAFEGITSMGDWAMEDMGTRQGKGELQGEKTALGGVVRSGEMVFGSTNRAHYGFGQSRQHEWVNNSNGIPNLAVPPVWTALTLEASDEGGLKIVGPRLVGQAKTDQAPAWFGNCIEVGYTKDERSGRRQLHMYLSEFIDDEGRRHLIKNRAEPGKLPTRMSDPELEEDAAGNITNPQVCGTQANLGLFFRLLDQALSEGVQEGREKYGEPSVVDDSVTDWSGGEAPGVPVAAKPMAKIAASGPAPVAAQGAGASPAASAPPSPSGIAIKPRVAVRKAPTKPAVVQQAEQQASKPIGAQLLESVAQLSHDETEQAGQPTEAAPPLPMDPPAPVSSPPLTVAPPSASKPGQPKAWAPPVRRVPPTPPA